MSERLRSKVSSLTTLETFERACGSLTEWPFPPRTGSSTTPEKHGGRPPAGSSQGWGLGRYADLGSPAWGRLALRSTKTECPRVRVCAMAPRVDGSCRTEPESPSASCERARPSEL